MYNDLLLKKFGEKGVEIVEITKVKINKICLKKSEIVYLYKTGDVVGGQLHGQDLPAHSLQGQHIHEQVSSGSQRQRVKIGVG